MDFDKSKHSSSKNRKRKRTASNSSHTSSNQSQEKTNIILPSFKYLSDDSSNRSTHEHCKNASSSLESRNLYLKVSSPLENSPRSFASRSKTRFLLRRAKYVFEAQKKKLPSELKSLLRLCSSRNKSFRLTLDSYNQLESCLKNDLSYETFYSVWSSAMQLPSSVSSDEEEDPQTSMRVNVRSTSSNSSSSQSSQTSKRKRRLSSSSSPSSLSEKDPDCGYEPPSAKRQQRVPSIYQSQPNSVASSVYPSPLDELLVQDIETESNISNGNSTEPERDDIKTQLEDDTTIPDSPNSLENSDDSNHSDDDDDDDTNDDSNGTSPRSGCPHHDCIEDCENESLEDEIISHIHSPYPAQFRHTTTITTTTSKTTHHHGERTPAPCSLEQCKSASENGKTSTTTTGDQQEKVKSFDDDVISIYNCMTPAAEHDPPRQCPLPALSWANAADVWQTMCKKDEEASCLRDASMLDRHSGLQPRMRAILLDWLIEVCEVYKLHRETYYLAVDYLDRYLNTKAAVQKTHLQLIGITCLFVAAKVEEIYPPKIGEFAYVTDGACQEADILHSEILLLQALDWDINPITPMGWLGMYMQLNVNNRTPQSFAIKNAAASNNAKESSKSETNKTAKDSEIDESFIYPQFSGLEFVQTAQLLDLCSLDVGVAHFPYSVLAAAAMSHTFNRETALRCSGLDWQTIQPCSRWMDPFFKVIATESEHLYLTEQNEQVTNKFGLSHICSNIITDDSHIIQTHCITMTMFDRVTQMQEHLLSIAKASKPEASPATGLICPEGLLTPPASSRKPVDVIDADLTKTAIKSATLVKSTAVATTSAMGKSNNSIVGVIEKGA